MTQAYIIEAEEWQALNAKIDRLTELVQKPKLTAPDPEELWTLGEIAQCGGGHYVTVAEKVRNAKKERKILTYKKDGEIAIPYKTILEMGLTVNPFLKGEK